MSMTQQPSSSYAGALIQNNNKKELDEFKFPTREEGLIAFPITGVETCDIVYKIGYITGPKKVKFASKANDKIFIFFSDKEDVNQVMKNRQALKIGNKEIKVERMITPTVRIILSNVCPILSHNIIGNVLSENNIKMASPVMLLRNGFKNKDFEHVYGARRHVYIYPDENNPLPESINFLHDKVNYRIFLMQDNMRCHVCKQEGHFANKCPFLGEPVENVQPENISENENVDTLVSIDVLEPLKPMETPELQKNPIIQSDEEPEHKDEEYTASSQNSNKTNIEANKNKNHKVTFYPEFTQIYNQDKNLETNKRPIQKTSKQADQQLGQQITDPFYNNQQIHQSSEQIINLHNIPSHSEQSTSDISPKLKQQEEISNSIPQIQNEESAEISNNETNQDQLSQEIRKQIFSELKQQLANQNNKEKTNKNSQPDIPNDLQQFIKAISSQSTPLKRPALTSTSSDENLTKIIEQENTTSKTTKKKPKSNDRDLDNQFKLFKEKVDNSPENYPISFEEFKDIVENSQGVKNKFLLVLEYTTETQKVIKMIDEAYPLLVDPKFKNRLTRLKNGLTSKQPAQNDDDILEP